MEQVLVTGASQGLGLSLARALAASGRFVFAAARNVDAMTTGLADYAGSVAMVRMDVSDEASVRAAIGEIKDRTSHLDVVINNAGILFNDTKDLPIESIDIAHMSRTIEVNSVGPMRVLKHALPLLEGGATRIILNISSDAGSISMSAHKSWFDYCMSKAALNMGTKILQNSLRERKIKVLAVHPGWVRTPMSGPEAALDPDDVSKKLLRLLERKWRMSDPVYLDNDGREMAW